MSVALAGFQAAYALVAVTALLGAFLVLPFGLPTIRQPIKPSSPVSLLTSPPEWQMGSARRSVATAW